MPLFSGLLSRSPGTSSRGPRGAPRRVHIDTDVTLESASIPSLSLSLHTHTLKRAETRRWEAPQTPAHAHYIGRVRGIERERGGGSSTCHSRPRCRSAVVQSAGRPYVHEARGLQVNVGERGWIGLVCACHPSYLCSTATLALSEMAGNLLNDLVFSAMVVLLLR